MTAQAHKARPATVTVWDWVVRLGHWLLAATIAGAWFTREGGGRLHEIIGYGSLAVVAVRFLWGFAGSEHARFADFIRGPRATLRYAGLVLGAREPRYLGHNPLGAWMIVTLLALVTATGLSGWLYTTDRYWGIEWVERMHSTLSDVLLAGIALHVLGVIFASHRHHERLVAAMFHGRKRPL